MALVKFNACSAVARTIYRELMASGRVSDIVMLGNCLASAMLVTPVKIDAEMVRRVALEVGERLPPYTILEYMALEVAGARIVSLNPDRLVIEP